jgi:lipopolysaccharide transport system ATP-binding protein
MSYDFAIKVEGLGKCYQIYNTPGDRLKQIVASPLRRLLHMPTMRYCREFWALKDVSFEVKKGETVGIVGRNGSGKSTLLQLICGTLSPSSGIVSTRGRIAALLELGSGFNPEFTGRENVYLNAAVLGLKPDEIEARFNSIAAFADIGDFIDQPIKTYSSGMIVRLAFSVAINADPEILVIDEALSVGDELFQRKCFSRIEAIRSAGATIFFVSHSGGAVIELCERAFLMEKGRLVMVGPPKAVFAQYQRLLHSSPTGFDSSIQEVASESVRELAHINVDSNAGLVAAETDPSRSSLDVLDLFDPELQPPNSLSYPARGAVIRDVSIYSLDGRRVNTLVSGGVYRYEFRVEFSRPARNVRFGMLMRTITGFEISGCATASSGLDGIPFVQEGAVFCIQFEFCCRLNQGLYFLNAGVLGAVEDAEVYLHRLVDAAVFRVRAQSETLRTGIFDLDIDPAVTLLQR